MLADRNLGLLSLRGFIQQQMEADGQTTTKYQEEIRESYRRVEDRSEQVGRVRHTTRRLSQRTCLGTPEPVSSTREHVGAGPL